jgi:hypothetical protein
MPTSLASRFDSLLVVSVTFHIPDFTSPPTPLEEQYTSRASVCDTSGPTANAFAVTDWIDKCSPGGDCIYAGIGEARDRTHHSSYWSQSPLSTTKLSALPTSLRSQHKMPSTDRSAPSPRGTLARLRDKLGDSNESSNSLASSSNSDDPNADLSLRPTTSDGVGTKLRDKLRRKSVDNRRDSEDSGKRLSNLMSRSRRRKPKNVSSSDLLDRQLSVDSNNGNLGLNLSTSSLDLAGSGGSSLLTDGESENEG